MITSRSNFYRFLNRGATYDPYPAEPLTLIPSPLSVFTLFRLIAEET